VSPPRRARRANRLPGFIGPVPPPTLDKRSLSSCWLDCMRGFRGTSIESKLRGLWHCVKEFSPPGSNVSAILVPNPGGGRLASKKQSRPAPAPRPSAAPARVAVAWPVVGAALVIAFAPLFRGLYFTAEQLVAALVVVALTLWAWGIRLARGEARWIRHPLDWAFLALLGSYLVSTFFAANYRDAVQSDIMNGTAFLIYWLVGEWGQEFWARAAVMGAVVTGATLAAFIGVGAGTGILTSNGAFVGGRVYTTFQYPDAAAAYLAAAFICALHLAGAERRVWLRSTLTALAAFCGAVFILCLSRGAELVLPLALAAYILLQPAGRRISTLLQVLATFIPAAAGAALALRALGHAPAQVWLWLGVGVAISLAFASVLRQRRPHTQLLVLGTGAVAVVLAGTVLLRNRLGALSRLGQLSFTSYNAWSRIRWTEDALRIFREHPIVGLGGGGWAASYFRYQSYGYFSTQVHDFFAQTLVEAGALGGLCLLAAAVVLVGAFTRTWRSAKPDERATLAGMAGAIVMLVAHGAIDFTLSLGAALLGVAALCGLLRASLAPWPPLVPHRATKPRRMRLRQRSARGTTAGHAAAIFGGGLVVMVLLSVLLAGFTVGQRAVAAATARQVTRAIPLYKEAISLDPLQASYRGDLAQLTVFGQSQPTPAMIAAAASLFREALRLDRFNPQLHEIFGEFLLRTGQVGPGLAEMHTAVADAPFDVSLYESLASADVQVAEADLSAQNATAAKSVLPDVDQLVKQLQHYSQMVPAVARPVYPTPSSTPNLQLAEGQAAALLGRWQPAVAALQPLTSSSDKSLAGISAAWLSVTYQMMGSSTQASKAASQSTSLLGAQNATQLMQALRQWIRPAA
jgi:O-antigen ligase